VLPTCRDISHRTDSLAVSRRDHSHGMDKYLDTLRGSVAEWLACWTRAQNGPGSNRSRDAVGLVLGKLFTPIVPGSEIGSNPLKGCGGKCRPGGK